MVCGAIAVVIMIKTKTAAVGHPSDFALATSASAQAALQLDPRGEEDSDSADSEVIDESDKTDRKIIDESDSTTQA